METRTIFNPIQLHLLKMFEVNSDEQSLSEMKRSCAAIIGIGLIKSLTNYGMRV